MSRFVLVLPGARGVDCGPALLAARCVMLWGCRDVASVDLGWCHTAYAGRMGEPSAGAVARDEATGSVLLRAGVVVDSKDGLADDRSLLSRYLREGAESLAGRLEGNFALCIVDAVRQEIVAITDITGACHIHTRTANGSVCALSSSPAALAALGESTLDATACWEFISTGVMYDDRTFHREVRRLSPACIFRLNALGGIASSRYWTPLTIEGDSLRGDRAVALFADAVHEAAARVSRGREAVVCDVTGGYDSRVVFGAMLGAHVVPAAFVSGPAHHPDVRVSREIATAFGAQHVVYDRNDAVGLDEIGESFTCTDGEYDVIEYAFILAAHRTTLSRGIRLNIIGSYGELARGYWWELLWPNASRTTPLDAGRLARLRYAAPADDAGLFPVGRDARAHFAGLIASLPVGPSLPQTRQLDHAYLALRMRSWHGKIASSTDRLRPCVSLFQLRRVLETVLAVDWRLRRNNRLVTSFLHRYHPKLAAIPLEHGYPAVPLTAATAWRFWPLVPKTAHRAWEKSWRMVRSRRPSGATPFAGATLRMRLWSTDEIRQLLDMSRMASAHILNPDALRQFLAESQSPDFGKGPQWTRLVSLEYAMRRIGEARRITAPGAAA